MKAWEIGERFGIERLRRVERDDETPGPGQLRFRPSAWSLNYRDFLVVTGTYNPRQRLPLVPLSDAAGTVDAVGEGVTRVKVGDRVMPIFAQRWLAGAPDREKLGSTLGSPHDGTARASLLLHEDGVVHIPDYLSDQEAATLPCAAVTAWSALFEHGALQPGQTVLVQGSGGVSTFALLLARLAGARVIATSSSAPKRERLRALGAFETLDYRADPAWGKTAAKITGGVDHVVDVGGAGTLEQSIAAVRPGGTISLIGVLEGGAGPVPLARALMNAIRLQGIIVGPRESFEHLLQAMTAAEIRPIIDRAFPFDELPAALDHMKNGAHFGKIVLTDGSA